MAFAVASPNTSLFISLLISIIALRSSGQQCVGVGNFPSACNNYTVNPTGNSPDTLSSLSVQGETVADDEREFLVNFGFLSTKGNQSRPTPYHDKVTLYAGIVGNPGTGDIWSLNTLVTQAPGSGDYDAQGIELDFNNANAHRGDADAGDGLAPPVSYGLSISGAAPFRSTAAMLVSGNAGLWNRGIVLANDCVVQSSFQDLGNPAKSIDIRGAPVYGVYQSNPTTKNFFAGKTGVGILPGADDAMLHVGGALAVGGRIVRRTHPSGSDDHSSLLSPGDAEWVVMQGNVVLDDGGRAMIDVLARSARLYQLSGCTYQLTAIGSPMPTLHVSDEVVLSALGSGVQFGVAGGRSLAKVSWTLSCPLS